MPSTTLSALLGKSAFSPPPPEVVAETSRRAEESEREERKRSQVAKLEAASIPPEFRGASLAECDERIRGWVDRIKGGSTRNLILQGEPGVGKSHGAAAALMGLLDEGRGLFARETAIMGGIRDTFNGIGTEAEVIARYSKPRFLVIDDFGKVKARDWYLPVIWEVIDERHTHGRPTIFTMQFDSSALARRLSTPEDEGITAAAIIDRMKDSDAVRLEGPSRRGHRE